MDAHGSFLPWVTGQLMETIHSVIMGLLCLLQTMFILIGLCCFLTSLPTQSSLPLGAAVVCAIVVMRLGLVPLKAITEVTENAEHVGTGYWRKVSSIQDYHINGKVQGCSCANAMELLQSCTKPSICKGIGEVIIVQYLAIGFKIVILMANYPDSKVHGANMVPIWLQQDSDGPHVGPMNLAIWVAGSIISQHLDGMGSCDSPDVWKGAHLPCKGCMFTCETTAVKTERHICSFCYLSVLRLHG